MEARTLNPTEEQLAILDAVSRSEDNLMLQAYAGCGKTSTLELIERAAKKRPVLYMVFAKKNAEEAEKRMLSTTTVRTFNSLGHRIWAKAVNKRLTLDSKKTQTILRSIIDEAPKGTKEEIWEVFWDIVNGVALAKAHGYVPEGKYSHVKRLTTQSAFHQSLDEEPDDLVSDLIDAVLTRSIVAAYEGNIDFNDQIYMPALFGGTYPAFPLVLVDEYQDLNPINHAMLAKLVKHRLIGVGDPHQSIYGFRGAKFGGMAEAVSTYKMTQLSLSVSFRCPSEIVKHVHWRVPQFKWIKEGGRVTAPTELSPENIHDNAAIICRNNAPLFRTALRLLSSGRSVSVAGSDIGPKLLAILRKLGPEELPRSAVLLAIDDWEAARAAKNSATAHDMAECLRVFANMGDSLGQAARYAQHLFEQRGTIRLLTGHKSKGLEFQNVYHLEPSLCRDTEQDENLRYVISTRSMDQLTEIPQDAIQWPDRQ